uniref:Sodium/calcium exchanger membrane region domain-containing protein n=1 Tax=Anopheles farauti TaxID=69004 RepID=A0A182QNQ6_9DIPT
MGHFWNARCVTPRTLTSHVRFCPTLAAIAKTLNISEALAGVTILAFGNGSPDLFTAVANPDADTELMFSELLGSAAFVIAVIGGAVLLIQPFGFAPWAISRDLAFFIASVVWITLKAADERFSLLDSSVLIGLYLSFLVLVIWEFVRAKREVQRTHSRSKGDEILVVGTILVLMTYRSTVSTGGGIPELHASYQNLRERAEILIRRKDPTVPSTTTPEESVLPPNEALLTDFCDHVNPLDLDEWRQGGWAARLFCLLKAPFVLLLLLTIPIVDIGSQREGWCKLLNICHCLTLPLLIAFVNEVAFLTMLSVPLCIWIALAAVPLMIIVFYTSRTDRCPPYHKMFTLLSFLGCIQVIYIVAQEVVSVLETLGIVMKLSKSMLGLSLLAWGNSVGDLFSNVALARQGYGKMAFAACFGGPLLNLCLGLGLTLMTKAFSSANLVAEVRKGVMGENCEIYLLQILTTTWLCLLFTNFQGRRSVGLSMIATYLMFLAFSFLGEFELIHPYGTDHHPDPNGG